MAIIPNITRAEYDALPGINWSRLKRGIGRTAAHIAAPAGADKAAYKFGRAFHHSVLQPDAFATWEIVPGKTTAKAGAITESERNDIYVMTAAAAALHEGKLSHIECGVTWKREGRECKALIDGVWDESFLFDLKSTQNAEPGAFKGEIFKFKYHGQCAWYLEGLAANGMHLGGATLLPVEKLAPYAAGFYFLEDGWIDLGRSLVNEALATLSEGAAGYGRRDLDVPDWAQPGLTVNEDGEIDL